MVTLGAGDTGPVDTSPGRKVTEVTPLFQIDDGRLMNQLPIWAPDAATRKIILVDNPTAGGDHGAAVACRGESWLERPFF